MNNELFMVKPSLKQIYGRTITKDTDFDEWTENKEVHQTVKDLVFTTEVHRKSDKAEETSKLVINLEEGQVLVWISDQDGYGIPNIAVCKLRELEEEIKQVKEIYKDNTDINPKEA